MMYGIDISAGSGVDFKALKDAGYRFVIARAGWGSKKKDNQIDRDFHSNIEKALAAGLHVGAYWFIYARTVPEAQENALRFHEAIERYRGKLDMPVYIDYEYDSTRYYQDQTGQVESREFATAAINVAALQMEQLGWFTGVYLNPDYIKNHVKLDELRQYSLWLAQWKQFDNNPAYACGMWQYSGDTYIQGVASGKVDLNVCYDDFPMVIREQGLNGFTREISGIYGDLEIGGHGIYGRAIRINENGTWEFVNG